MKKWREFTIIFLALLDLVYLFHLLVVIPFDINIGYLWLILYPVFSFPLNFISALAPFIGGALYWSGFRGWTRRERLLYAAAVSIQAAYLLALLAGAYIFARSGDIF